MNSIVIFDILYLPNGKARVAYGKNRSFQRLGQEDFLDLHPIYRVTIGLFSSSRAVLDHYQSKKAWPGQEKHIHKISGWL